MEIKFTYHAIRRIEERKISLYEIFECLANHDKTVKKDDVAIFYKSSKDIGHILFLVCSFKKEECKIITVIRTSQIKRYL